MANESVIEDGFALSDAARPEAALSVPYAFRWALDANPSTAVNMSTDEFMALGLSYPSLMAEPYKKVIGIAYAERVDGASRGAWEQRHRGIFQAVSAANLASFNEVPPSERRVNEDEYYPFTLVGQDNQQWVGFDVLSDPARAGIIRQAVLLRDLSLGPLVSIVINSTIETVTRFALPWFNTSDAKHPLGVFIGSLYLPALVSSVATTSHATQSSPLVLSLSELSTAHPSFNRNQTLIKTANLPAADRTYVLSCSTRHPPTDSNAASATPLLILLLLLLLTFTTSTLLALLLARLLTAWSRLRASRRRLRTISRSRERVRVRADAVLNAMSDLLIAVDAGTGAVVGLNDVTRRLCGLHETWEGSVGDLIVAPGGAEAGWVPMEGDLRVRGACGLIEAEVRASRVADGDVVVLVLRDVGERNSALREVNEARRVAESQCGRFREFMDWVDREVQGRVHLIEGLMMLVWRNHPIVYRDASLSDKLYHVEICARVMGGLLRDVVELAKIDVGKLELRPVAVAVCEIPAQALDGLRATSLAGEDDMTIRVHVDEPVPKCVEGDPCRLIQIFEHLLANSLQYSSGSEIYARIRYLTQRPVESVEAGAEYGTEALLRFEVEDSRTTSVENLKRMFTPYHPLNAIGRYSLGTSIGLAIVHHLVSKMGGCLTVTYNEELESLVIAFELWMPILTAESDDTVVAKAAEGYLEMPEVKGS
ncbi:hypothetical protein HK101_005365 [Irineochytrium annulatum]|nr:hypothetical protein HK101_005365 [Irineochytrium annulatum]